MSDIKYVRVNLRVLQNEKKKLLLKWDSIWFNDMAFAVVSFDVISSVEFCTILRE